MEPDFCGYATKVGLECSDGRTILPDAFAHQDKHQVPLVWQHSHDDPENVLGHVLLSNRADGVWAEAFFNKTPRAQAAKEAVIHGDITQMSIWANKLIERAKQVQHGMIREVSLVISGANPGALIDPITIAHSDGTKDTLEGQAIIYTPELIHTNTSTFEEPIVEHEDGDPAADDDGTTIQDVYDSMSQEQKDVLHYLVGEGIAAASKEKEDPASAAAPAAAHSSLNEQEEGSEVKHNVFEESGATMTGAETTLSHDDLKEIVGAAERTGSLAHAFRQYAKEHLEHGIDSIDVLFPDAKLIGTEPEFLQRRMEWVNSVLGACRKSPFARIRTVHADITEDEARAKGYVTGEFKREEFFELAKRETTPQTIYKKQKLERDDIIDITDLDVVVWLKGEMRVMLDEEIARAVLIGDGRDIASSDKISETHIRPVAKDNELYTSVVNLNLDNANSTIQEFIDAVVANRHLYKGSGMPSLYTSETVIARFLLLKDAVGRRLYKSLQELAEELRVKEIVPVEAMDDEPDIVAVMVNFADYNLGTDRGGEVNMFDDFDIDYNNYKYLIETRLSGALVRLKSAIVFKKVEGADILVVPTAPTFDEELGEVTITNTTGVIYKNGAGTVINAAGSPYTVADGSTYVVTAEPDTGYYFATSDGDTWNFTMPAV
jgi:HK97 family phage prohead protease